MFVLHTAQWHVCKNCKKQTLRQTNSINKYAGLNIYQTKWISDILSDMQSTTTSATSITVEQSNHSHPYVPSMMSLGYIGNSHFLGVIWLLTSAIPWRSSWIFYKILFWQAQLGVLLYHTNASEWFPRVNRVLNFQTTIRKLVIALIPLKCSFTCSSPA